MTLPVAALSPATRRAAAIVLGALTTIALAGGASVYAAARHPGRRIMRWSPVAGSAPANQGRAVSKPLRRREKFDSRDGLTGL
jgi:hypothetical protein